MIAMQHTYKTCNDVRFRALDDEGIVVRQQAGEVIVLNAAGTRVIELVAAGASGASIVDQLEQEYDTDRATLERDVAAHLAELLEANVIEPAPSAA
jgi:elongation factor P hydroxylase